MALKLTDDETKAATQSLKRYFAEEFDEGLGDLRAKLVLDYILKEIAPLASNRRVEDAGELVCRQVEELPAACFEPPFSHRDGRAPR
ncbi:MAG: DUF2164 domain-containing protein [Cephaloticoccus sp.]